MSPDDLAAQLEQLHAAAFGWALSCCGWDRSVAEDALQSSYLKILDGRARFAGRSSFRTWVFGVIRRTAQEAQRRALLGRWLPFTRWLLEPEAADGRPDPEAVRRRGRVAGLAVAAAAALLLFAVLRPGGRRKVLVDLDAARWEAPTDFLLRTPGAELLRAVPRLILEGRLLP